MPPAAGVTFDDVRARAGELPGTEEGPLAPKRLLAAFEAAKE